MISYDRNGKETTVKNEDFVFAKKDDEKQVFLVKKCTAGLNSGHLLDVRSIWFNPGEERASDRRTGKKVYEFTKVTQSCFDLYIKYLQTTNKAYILNAEREIQ